MKRNEKWDALSAPDYYDEAITGNYEAIYYLLKRRLGKALNAVYELHGFGLSDDYEDTIDDYYLYLFEGNQSVGQQPFNALRSIQNKQAFFGWMVATYRHFLFNRAKEEMRRKELLEFVRMSSRDDEYLFSNETMIWYLATAIAYADQQFPLRNRFIFYRMLLSFLDHSKAIPQEPMAFALVMQPVTYRVCSKRQKDRFLDFILTQEAGATLDLDAAHRLMRDRIVDGFEQLYKLLMEFYLLALEGLPEANHIQALRLKYGHGDGMMHEGRPAYGYGNDLDINILYPNLKGSLEVSG